MRSILNTLYRVAGGLAVTSDARTDDARKSTPRDSAGSGGG